MDMGVPVISFQSLAPFLSPQKSAVSFSRSRLSVCRVNIFLKEMFMGLSSRGCHSESPVLATVISFREPARACQQRQLHLLIHFWCTLLLHSAQKTHAGRCRLLQHPAVIMWGWIHYCVMVCRPSMANTGSYLLTGAARGTTRVFLTPCFLG